MTRETWLNGWYRSGYAVVIGTCLCCICCGKSLGLICLAMDDDYDPPAKLPDWPFDEDGCPLCSSMSIATSTVIADVSVEDLANLPASRLRQALIKVLAKENRGRRSTSTS